VERYVADENGAALCVDGFCEGEVDTCVEVLSRVDNLLGRKRIGDRFDLPEPPPVMIAPFFSSPNDDTMAFDEGLVTDCVSTADHTIDQIRWDSVYVVASQVGHVRRPVSCTVPCQRAVRNHPSDRGWPSATTH
jgi:hypothetical protein